MKAEKMDPIIDPHKITLTKKVSPITFETEIEKPYISEETKQKLRGAKILIIPQDDYQLAENRVLFPSGTIDLFRYFTEHVDSDIEINICIEERDYQEIGLHADIYFIAQIILYDFCFPLVVGLLGSYIYDLLKGKNDDTIIKSKIIVINEKDKQSVEYSYTGPASEYEKSINQAINSFSVEIQSEDIKHKKHSRRKRDNL